MKHKLKTGLILFGLFFPSFSWAAAKVLLPLPSQVDFRTAQTIAGVSSSGEVTPIQVDASGNLMVSLPAETSGAVLNFKVLIPLVGPADRVQIPSHPVHSCLLQAPFGNTGAVFVGGATVTNSSGSNEGIQLNAGDTFGEISLSDSNWLYVAAAKAGDAVKLFCN